MGSKRKRIDCKNSGGVDGKRKRKKKLQGVPQFIDIDAAVVDNESSDFSDEIVEDEFSSDFQIKNEPGKVPLLPFSPELFDGIEEEEEFDKMLEERYKAGSSLVTVAAYGCETEPLSEKSAEIFSDDDPTIWKVKCMVGRERHSAFCLMQKYVDLKSLGTELQIISVFALEHRRGFIFIEAYKQCHINEACKGLCNINLSNMSPVPKNELSRLLYVRSKCSEISAGTWARVKRGKYKGDLAQVVALNKSRKKATVKLIPRIDLQALAEKIGRGVSSKKTAIPQPRLISSRELEEFRPLIQYRRDRDVGEVYEVLDGMMLKDGYLFKKVPVDSLIFWGVVLSENERLRFEPSGNDESKDLEWLSLLYGEKNTTVIENEGVQGEGWSSSSVVNSFQVHDLVFFGRCCQKDFGVIIETEEDDSFKILKEDCEGQVVVSFRQGELQKASFNKKFTALDQHMKVVCINDSVKILEGPLKDKQGVVKQIYRGTIFLHNVNEQENNGYFCCKAQTCEKIILSVDGCDKKVVESEASGSGKIFRSPKSPLLAKKGGDNNPNRGKKDGMFSIGQSLRISVGPLKGYLCRVMAIQDSNVTVKLDSQHNILTVKCENLSDPRVRKSAISTRGIPRSVKSSSLLGIQDSTRGRIDGVAISTESKRQRTTAGLSTQRISRPAFPASSFSPESGFANRLNHLNHALKKGNNVIGNRSSWRGTVNAGKKPMDSRGDEKGGGFSWKKPGAGCWNKQIDGGRSLWSKQGDHVHKKTEATRQNKISERQKSFGRGQVFGGWNKRTMIDKDSKSFGFERGRGGRGGGRGVFGVRRSLGRGRPSALTKGSQQNYGTSEGNCTKNQYNGGQAAVGRGRGNKGSWGAEAGGGWKGNAGAMGSQFNHWNKPAAASGTERRKQGGFNAAEEDEGDRSWNRGKSFGRGRGFGGGNYGNNYIRGRGIIGTSNFGRGGRIGATR